MVEVVGGCLCLLQARIPNFERKAFNTTAELRSPDTLCNYQIPKYPSKCDFEPPTTPPPPGPRGGRPDLWSQPHDPAAIANGCDR